MRAKSLRIILSALAILTLTSSLALARGHGGGQGGCPGMGGGWGQLSPEKQAAFQKLHDAFAAKTAQLRADLGVKMAELNALSVAATSDGDELTLTIADTGPGFCPDNKDRVLDPFFTTKDAGTGLGLAIVRTIVESHNAALALDNAPEGGAQVTMTFTAA